MQILSKSSSLAIHSDARKACLRLRNNFIDSEVRRLVQEAYDTAKRILTRKRAQLDVLAEGLIEFETLSGEEIVSLLAGKRPVREEPTPVVQSTAPPITGEGGLAGGPAAI